MRKNKVQTIVWVSAIAVIILVILQVNWIHQALKLREDQFDRQVKMAMCTAVSELYQTAGLAGEVARCLESKPDMQNCLASIPADVDRKLLDEIVGKAMAHHGIDLEYRFDLVSNDGCCEEGTPLYTSNLSDDSRGYSCSLTPFASGTTGSVEVNFPGKTRHILSQMKFMLGSSLLVVAFISLTFFFAARTVMDQKQLTERNVDFFNNMAHEFKTPLTNISLAGKMLSQGENSPDPAKSARLLSVIQQENEKLKQQVERVLQLAQIEKGELTLAKEELDLHKILSETIETGSLQIQCRGGKVATNLSAVTPKIQGDAFHLKNVFSNLLENANKYSPNAPQVNIETTDHVEGVMVSVTDHGEGMSQEKQQYIFDKFYRAVGGNIHATKGFGLGLAYVKMIVDAHQGWIKVRSEIGKGSCFQVFLPFAANS